MLLCSCCCSDADTVVDTRPLHGRIAPAAAAAAAPRRRRFIKEEDDEPEQVDVAAANRPRRDRSEMDYAEFDDDDDQEVVDEGELLDFDPNSEGSAMEDNRPEEEIDANGQRLVRLLLLSILLMLTLSLSLYLHSFRVQ